MDCNIEIINCKEFVNEDVPTIYCGRGNAPFGWPNANLGNPFHIGEHGDRAEVCELYADAMRGQFDRVWPGQHHKRIQSIAKRIKKMGYKHVRLACWCHPAQCHCETIKNLIEANIQELS